MMTASLALEPLDLECIETEWVSNERVLRVYVDKRQGSNLSPAVDIENSDAVAKVTMQACVNATRVLLERSEFDELVPGAYNLEVSSPGIERPLRLPSHFERHLGEKVRVRLANAVGSRRQGAGLLAKVQRSETVASDNPPIENYEVTLETEQGAWVFPLGCVSRASLIHDWGAH